jgi:hypothetical protein
MLKGGNRNVAICLGLIMVISAVVCVVIIWATWELWQSIHNNSFWTTIFF